MDRLAAIGVTLAVVAATLESHAQSSVTELNFAAVFDEYCDVEYVPMPVAPARHVYFSEEPIYIKLSVGNPGATEQPFSFGRRPTPQAFDVQVRRAPAGAPVFRLELASTGRVVTAGPLRETHWSDDVEIPSQGELVFVAQLIADGPVAPGAYELQVSPRSLSRPVNLRATLLRFEFRPLADQASRAEIVRRRMAGAFAHDVPSQARGFAEELLRIYPQSASAHLVLGELALRDGDAEQARRAFSRAKALMGADTFSIAHARPAVRKGLETTIDQGLAKVSRRPGR